MAKNKKDNKNKDTIEIEIAEAKIRTKTRMEELRKESHEKSLNSLRTVSQMLETSNYDPAKLSAHLINAWRHLDFPAKTPYVKFEELKECISEESVKVIQEKFDSLDEMEEPCIVDRLKISFDERANTENPFELDTVIQVAVNSLFADNDLMDIEIADYDKFISYLLSSIEKEAGWSKYGKVDREFEEDVKKIVKTMQVDEHTNENPQAVASDNTTRSANKDSQMSEEEVLSMIDDIYNDVPEIELEEPIVAQTKSGQVIEGEYVEHTEDGEVVPEELIEPTEETDTHSEPQNGTEAEKDEEPTSEYVFTDDEQAQRNGYNEWEKAIAQGVKQWGEEYSKQECDRMAKEKLAEMMADYLGRKKQLEKDIYGRSFLLRAISKLIFRPIKGLFRLIKQMFGGTPNYSKSEIELMELKEKISDIKKNGVEFVNGKLYQRERNLEEKLADLEAEQSLDEDVETLDEDLENDKAPDEHSNDTHEQAQPAPQANDKSNEVKQPAKPVWEQEKEKLCNFMNVGKGKNATYDGQNFVIASVLSQVANGQTPLSEKRALGALKSKSLQDMLEGKTDKAKFFISMDGPEKSASDEKDNKVKLHFTIEKANEKDAEGKDHEICKVSMHIGDTKKNAQHAVSLNLPAELFTAKNFPTVGIKALPLCIAEYSQCKFADYSCNKVARAIKHEKAFKGGDIEVKDAKHKDGVITVDIEAKVGENNESRVNISATLDLKTLEHNIQIPENIEAQLTKEQIDRAKEIAESLHTFYANYMINKTDVPLAKYMLENQHSIADKIQNALTQDKPSSVYVNGLELTVTPANEKYPHGAIFIHGDMGGLEIAGSAEKPITHHEYICYIYAEVEKHLQSYAREYNPQQNEHNSFKSYADELFSDNLPSNNAGYEYNAPLSQEEAGILNGETR